MSIPTTHKTHQIHRTQPEELVARYPVSRNFVHYLHANEHFVDDYLTNIALTEMFGKMNYFNTVYFAYGTLPVGLTTDDTSIENLPRFAIEINGTYFSPYKWTNQNGVGKFKPFGACGEKLRIENKQGKLVPNIYYVQGIWDDLLTFLTFYTEGELKFGGYVMLDWIADESGNIKYKYESLTGVEHVASKVRDRRTHRVIKGIDVKDRNWQVLADKYDRILANIRARNERGEINDEYLKEIRLNSFITNWMAYAPAKIAQCNGQYLKFFGI